MLPRPPTSTLFPYTTLFRSGRRVRVRNAPQYRRRPRRRARVTRSATDVVADELEVKARVEDPDRLRAALRSEEHTSELQSQFHLVCRLLLEKKNPLLQHPVR